MNDLGALIDRIPEENSSDENILSIRDKLKTKLFEERATHKYTWTRCMWVKNWLEIENPTKDIENNTYFKFLAENWHHHNFRPFLSYGEVSQLCKENQLIFRLSRTKSHYLTVTFRVNGALLNARIEISNQGTILISKITENIVFDGIDRLTNLTKLTFTELVEIITIFLYNRYRNVYEPDVYVG